MKVLLLAAGLGTRLKPLTDQIPKCLVPIRGKPLLSIWLDLFRHIPDTEFLINTHYKPEQIEAFVAKHPLREKIQTIHERDLLGTGGTLLANKKFLGPSDAFIVAHADNLTTFDPLRFLEAHRSRPEACLATMMTFLTPTPQSCGIVECDDRGVVQKFYEKVPHPPSNLANGAIYVFEPGIFPLLESIGSSHIDLSTQIIPKLMGKIYTFENKIYLRDIGTPQSLSEAQKDFPIGS